MYEDKLGSSPTAFGGESDPTSSDLSNQESLQRIRNSIQTLNDQRLKTKWYGTDTTVNAGLEKPQEQGLIGKTLDFVSRPLYGVVGATKHFVGQGSDSLYMDIADNMEKNKNTFGDVLRTAGAPGIVSAPLGLALDIGMDPVNWLTVGTSALLPRVTVGAYRGFSEGSGILRGMGTAAKSGVLEKANTIGKFTPFLRKTETFSKFGKKVLGATSEWEALSGRTAADIVQNTGLLASFNKTVGTAVNKMIDSVPGARNFFEEVLAYRADRWVDQIRKKDIMVGALGNNIDYSGMAKEAAAGRNFDDLLNKKIKFEPFVEKANIEFIEKTHSKENFPGTLGRDILDPELDKLSLSPSNKDVEKAMATLSSVKGIDMEKIKGAMPKVVNDVDDAITLGKKPNLGGSVGNEEIMKNLYGESGMSLNDMGITTEDIKNIVKSGVLGDTGVRWYDNTMRSVKNFQISGFKNKEKTLKIGSAVLDGLDKIMGIFHAAVVEANPTSHANNIVSNYFMRFITTGFNDDSFKNLSLARKVIMNKPGAAAELDKMIPNSMRELFKTELRGAAMGTFGSIDFLDTKYTSEIVRAAAQSQGFIKETVSASEIEGYVKKTLDEAKVLADKIESGTTNVRKLQSSGKEFSSLDLGTSQTANEFYGSPVNAKMMQAISDKASKTPLNVADPASWIWHTLDFTFNKMAAMYTKEDQMFKLSSFIDSAITGLTKNQIQKISPLLTISPEEIELGKIAVGGEFRYRLSPTNALKLANITHLNYNAMPAAVKILRNIPLLNSPFVSFTYAMAVKTGQTLAYNPAAFNKVTFAMKELSGDKSPLEKKALDTKFYSYLNQPGMFKLPFFDKYPTYLNLTNMIPYYSLNIFNPSMSKYGDTLPEQLVEGIQKSPFLKNPIASTMFDYLVVPQILGDSIQPQGQFGQPLYPYDATGVEKAMYGTRSLAESFFPGVLAYAGLLTPQAMAEYLPSYKWRKLTRAVAGKNQLGVSTKENPVSSTIRALLQTSGVPVQAPVNTSFSQNNSNSSK